MSIGPVEAILLTPLLMAAILALLPGYRIGAGLNVAGVAGVAGLRPAAAVATAAHRHSICWSTT